MYIYIYTHMYYVCIYIKSDPRTFVSLKKLIVCWTTFCRDYNTKTNKNFMEMNKATAHYLQKQN